MLRMLLALILSAAIVLLTALSVLLMLCIRWVRYPIRQARSTAGKK